MRIPTYYLLRKFYIQRHDSDGDHIYGYPTAYLKAGGVKGVTFQVCRNKAIKASMRNAYPHFDPIGEEFVPTYIREAILARAVS